MSEPVLWAIAAALIILLAVSCRRPPNARP